MNVLKITGDTTLHPPDSDGNVSIKIIAKSGCTVSKVVSFEKIKKWITLIKEPCNQVNAPDSCSLCVPFFRTNPSMKYCGGCGNKLNR